MPTGPAWYTTLNQIIGAASVIVFLVLMVILIPAVVKFRKTATKFEAVLDHIERSIDPVTQHASNIADNIDYITTSIRADVQAIRKTLLVANDGIRDVVDVIGAAPARARCGAARGAGGGGARVRVHGVDDRAACGRARRRFARMARVSQSWQRTTRRSMR